LALQEALTNPSLSEDELQRYHTEWVRLAHRITDVQLLDNDRLTVILSRATGLIRLIDYNTGFAFNIDLRRSGGHFDWSPMSVEDTSIIKQILHPGRHIDCDSWYDIGVWGSFATHRGGILEIDGQFITVGFHLRPHGTVIGDAEPGSPLRNPPESNGIDGRAPPGGWTLGGHMCLYVSNSTGGTEGLQDVAHDVYDLFN